MSTVLHMSPFAPTPYGLKEKPTDSFAPAFTSVNGRSSMSPPNDQNSAAPRGVPRPPESGYQSSSSSASPIISSGETSPKSPNSHKRRRSTSEEHHHLHHSPASTAARPPAAYQSPTDLIAMDNPQQHRNLPLPAPEAERRWVIHPRESSNSSGYQETQQHEPRPAGSAHSDGPSHASMAGMNDSNGHDEPEMTRAGVHVELKKRKRQFANRTKTGCGTCRRRKKKCDEAKPECNNCTRGGFICEGYANKIPWPKNGASKPPPPLQAKERMAEIAAGYARCPVCNQIHIPHCEPVRQNSYPETHQPHNVTEGARNRPINVEEHERKPPAPSTWNNGQPPPPRAPYPPEAQQPTQYTQPLPTHERQPSHEHQQVAHQRSDPPPQRQHNPRVYHHTPQTMSQVVANPSPVSAYPMANIPTTSAPPPEPVSRHPSVQHPRQPPPPAQMAPITVPPPGPAPNHYGQQSILHKTEKEKMLAGEPFLPFDRQLVDERLHCTGAVYRFNNTSNTAVSIASDERARFFKGIVAARWIPPRITERHVVSHLGGNVHVTTPFHCDYGYNLSIAENVVIGPNCHLLDSARICIGRNTKIGARVTVQTLKTPTDTKVIKGSNGNELAQQVWIGENVYIGDGCIIEAGVRIGDHAIVRAGSVVVRDLPSHCVAHGNPAFG